jgi:hypothetical protein
MVITDVPGTMMSRSSMGKDDRVASRVDQREPHDDGMIQNITTVGRPYCSFRPSAGKFAPPAARPCHCRASITSITCYDFVTLLAYGGLYQSSVMFCFRFTDLFRKSNTIHQTRDLQQPVTTRHDSALHGVGFIRPFS